MYDGQLWRHRTKYRYTVEVTKVTDTHVSIVDANDKKETLEISEFVRQYKR